MNEGQGELRAESARLFERTWSVPTQAYILPSLIAAMLFAAWLATPEQRAAAMMLSWPAIEEGRTSSIWLHMFAHGGLLHVTLNCAALLALGPPLIARLGSPPLSWLRFIYLFVGSGLAGAALFLAMSQTSPMLGASGAIFGVFGALARVHPTSGALVPVRSRRTLDLVKAFITEHLYMFGLVAIFAILGGRFAGIAWQAHLGGLLFGVAAASVFLERGNPHPVKHSSPDS